MKTEFSSYKSAFRNPTLREVKGRAWLTRDLRAEAPLLARNDKTRTTYRIEANLGVATVSQVVIKRDDEITSTHVGLFDSEREAEIYLRGLLDGQNESQRSAYLAEKRARNRVYKERYLAKKAIKEGRQSLEAAHEVSS